MVLGEGSVWVANLGSGTLTSITESSGATDEIKLPDGAEPADIAFADDAIWVSDRTGNVIRVSPVSGETRSFPVGAGPKGIAVLDGDVWVANTDDGSVWRLNADGDRLDQVQVGGLPRGLEADATRDVIWVANGGDGEGGDGRVTMIDPDDPQHFTDVAVPGSPEEVAVGPDHVWASTGSGDQLVSITP
jgi:streptogramin lyase